MSKLLVEQPIDYVLLGQCVYSGAGVETPVAMPQSPSVNPSASGREHHIQSLWPKQHAKPNKQPLQLINRRLQSQQRASTNMSSEDNGNVGLIKPTSSSNEDLSEYTDADESISAPTEFLAEFLSAVMLKDYITALKYCKLILQYEPNNATAKEFYPLILDKLQQIEDDSAEDEGDNSSSSSDSESSSSSEESEDEEEDEEAEVGRGDKQSKGSSDGDATTGSYSSLEDDEAETDQLAALAAKFQIDNVNLGNGNKIYDTNFKHQLSKSDNGTLIVASTNVPFGTSSDSESPTEPLSQQTVQMLRARIVPNKH